MARKGKGKFRRRIKDWRQRFAAGEDADRLAARGRKLSAPAVKLPPARAGQPVESLESLPRREGLVAGMFRHGAMVRFDDRRRFCAIAKTFRSPAGATALAVGDAVTVALSERQTEGRLEIDSERAEGFILSRRPRAGALSRPQPMSAKRLDPYGQLFEKVIVANMDRLLVVASTRQPTLNPRLIDRFLIVAERGEMRPAIAVNKIDLAAPSEDDRAYFASLGVPAVLCSAVTGAGLDELRGLLAGRRTVLAGASGVGKSSLINALVPGAEAATREVRMKDERGRHTTASAAVYDLPATGAADGGADAPVELPTVGAGGVLVDTPGLRELGLPIGGDELPWYFPEFEPYAPLCRMSRCTHVHEPACAVIRAVDEGLIPPRRYDSYLRMRESIEP